MNMEEVVVKGLIQKLTEAVEKEPTVENAFMCLVHYTIVLSEMVLELPEDDEKFRAKAKRIERILFESLKADCSSYSTELEKLDKYLSD